MERYPLISYSALVSKKEDRQQQKLTKVLTLPPSQSILTIKCCNPLKKKKNCGKNMKTKLTLSSQKEITSQSFRQDLGDTEFSKSQEKSTGQYHSITSGIIRLLVKEGCLHFCLARCKLYLWMYIFRTFLSLFFFLQGIAGF